MEIDSKKLKKLQTHHVRFVLIDLRSPEEYERGHIEGAKNIPSGNFIGSLEKQISQKDAAIVIYDQKGLVLEDLVTKAEGLGYLNVVFLEGGYEAYLKN